MIKKHRLIPVLRSTFLLSILFATNITSTVIAIDEDFYQSNDILFYSPSGTACVAPGVNYTTSTTLPTLTGADNAEKVWNFLTDSKYGGLTKEQAAGVMGNIRQESNFDPDAREPNGIGYGIVQWSFTRRIALEAAALLQGVPSSDLAFQLKFMVDESKTNRVNEFVLEQPYYRESFGEVGDNEWETLKKQLSTEDATLFFHASFEKSADTYDAIKAGRLTFADEIFKKFSGGAGSSTTGSNIGATSSSNCTPFAGGDLIQTLLAYAHPEYHENNFTSPDPPPKQAYLDIATKLDGENKWVGGGKQEIGIPGIDCGGFVSILLTQSGFEPDYNFGLDKDRGASNQEYGQLPWAKRNWSFLGTGGSINTSDLRPGDVAYSNGHTFVFVGQVDGFDSQYASASYSWWRSPMAGGSFETATNADYVWYGRREGTPPAYGTTKMSDPIPAGNDVNPGTSVWAGGDR